MARTSVLVFAFLLGILYSTSVCQLLIILVKTESIESNTETEDNNFMSYCSEFEKEENKLIRLNGEKCSENSVSGSLLVSMVKNVQNILFTHLSLCQWKPQYVAIICSKCLQECAILRTLVEKIMNISSILLIKQSNNYNNIPNALYSIPPTSFLVDAFMSVFKSLQWNRLGFIVDYSDIFFAGLAKHVVSTFKESAIIHPGISSPSVAGNKHLMSILQRVEESGAKVLILLTQEAPQILCAAYHRGMVWPEYGWLLYDSRSLNTKQLPTCAGSHLYLQGTVFLTYYNSPITKADLEESTIRLLSLASTKATQQHLDLTSALLTMSVPGIQPNIIFRDIQKQVPVVYFLQITNGSISTVAEVYNGTVLVNRWLQEEQLPRGTLPVRVNTVYPIWLGAVEVIVSGTLITITLVLYVYYRKEPEVRASSWTLSLLMLLGCYLLAIHLLLLILQTSVHSTIGFSICAALVWTSGIGLSYPLILAVLLVKLVRVYRIFYHYSQIGRLCSDVALAIYVLALMSPIILILIVMTSLQHFHDDIGYYLHKNYIEVVYVCSGDLRHYFIALASCICPLIVMIIIAALKTRNLQHRNFRDAKKINSFVFFFVLVIAFELVHFFLLTGLLENYIFLHFTHCILIGLCLGFLFLPKLLPIIYRNLLRAK